MQHTKIEWAHHTFNPWIGCTKAGPGCDNCYAEADFDKRRHVVQWGPNQPRKRTASSTWAQPLRWNKMAEAEGTRHRVFCASLADVFDNEVPSEWRKDLFNLILSTPHLDWLLLTKRIGNAQQMIESVLPSNMKALPADNPLSWPWPNIWIGATITNQAEADRDIPKLLAVPAAKRFLSMEPLLGPVDLAAHVAPPSRPFFHPGTPLCDELPSAVGCARTGRAHYPGEFGCRWSKVNNGGSLPTLDWVIVGGESGPNARPMHPDWARSLRDQCQVAGVPFLFKQWGEWLPPYAAGTPDKYLIQGGMSALPVTKCGNAMMTRVGKKSAGRMLDGREWDEVPA